MEIRWSDNEHISELVDSITHACSKCGNPARVPEDVAAVVEEKGIRTPLVVCPDCSPEFTEELRVRLGLSDHPVE